MYQQASIGQMKSLREQGGGGKTYLQTNLNYYHHLNIQYHISRIFERLKLAIELENQVQV